ncbi:MAG: xanthine dehydrogenase family protein molybdopterin-binding subunit [Acidobacteriota bacterium]
MSVVIVNRRQFLTTSAAAAGGLLVGFTLPGRTAVAAIAQGSASSLPLNAFVHIGTDDLVTLIIHKSEMGQGTVTSLSMLIAEELECRWESIRNEFAPVEPAYGVIGVYGSNSIRTSWQPLRLAGATAREMLVSAAAERWGVDRSLCHAENGTVVNRSSGARLTYGALAEAAAKLPVPATPALKSPSAFKLIGSSPKRLDTPAKVDGSATFGIDVRLPGMLYAVVARSPVFGGKLSSVDATKAKAIPGVKQVLQVSTGVAVIAENTWSAMEGRRALTLTWDEGPNASASSAGIRELFVKLAAQPGAEAARVGDPAAALASAAKRVDAVYEAPYLAHAPMEPLNCVAHVTASSCEVWVSTQAQTSARDIAARASGVPPVNVKVHTLFLGGGFGRRAQVDYIGEAVEIAKALNVPVKVTWSREDDIRHDLYRPASYVQFSGGLDVEGWPVAITARVVCPSFGFSRGGVDGTAVEGITPNPYQLPNFLVEYQRADAGIPTTYWRSVGYSQNTFFLEAFIDELAAAGGKDPLEVRRRLLAGSPRMLAALNLAASKAGWGSALPAGRARGLSVVNNIGSFTAQVAEVSVDAGVVHVHRVVCAVDCGAVVNPAGVESQIISGIGTGLSAALKDGITIDAGRVVQGNFNNYRVMKMPEAPVIDVHTVPSQSAPGGIGEASTPGIAPAVANAIFAATRKRVRVLPIRLDA